MKDFYGELAEYLSRSRELVERRCQYAPVELAWQWEKFKTNPLKYYRESDLYVFDLTMYHSHLQQRGTHSWFADTIKRYGWKTMLDYGGGTGEYTIIAAQEGVKSDFTEVKGSKTLEYAKWRFKKYGVSPQIFYEDHKIDEQYDFIVIMDVLEHLEEPEPVIEMLAKHTKYIFVNPDEIQYNWLYPQHISKFSLDKHFEIVDRYLWEKK